MGPEPLLREFPELDEDDADAISSYCETQDALDNILDIMRSCPKHHVREAGSIIQQHIEENDPELISELHIMEDNEDDHLGSWYLDGGFPDVRTQALKAALATMDMRSPDEVLQALSDLEPWIRQMEEMLLKPAITDWESCLDLRRRSQHHVLNRHYDENTAELLGVRDALYRWKSPVGIHKVDNLTIIPVLSQEELATEAALTAPDIYPRYIHRCIANSARPFVVYDDRSEDLSYRNVTLCVLRLRKGKWQLSEPTHMNADENLIRTLQGFAKKYNTLTNRKVGNKPAPKHVPQLKEVHICRRCNPAAQTKESTYHNTPGRCPTCQEEYGNRDPDTRTRNDQEIPELCSSCGNRQAQYIAKASKKNRRICAVCELISRDFTIFDQHSQAPLTTLSCHRCGQPLTRRREYGLCPDCTQLAQEERTRQRTLITYVQRVLEAREGNAPEPEPPPAVQMAGRDGLTTLRPDAGSRRLTASLSVELCREYVEETRFIPELALRFNVSATVVRDTLTGRTWQQHTEGSRPGKLRDDPPPDRKPPKERPPKPAHITVSRLKGQYGWTDSLISKHLGEYDQEAPNPHYRSAAPMRLYLLDRVQSITADSSKLRQALQATLDRREQNEQDRHRNDLLRREKLLRQVAGLKPQMRALPTRNTKALMRMATRDREEFLRDNGLHHYLSDVAPSEEGAVNMLRHDYTNYELLLGELPHTRNVETNMLLYHDVKRRTLEMIAEELPELKDTCEIQIALTRTTA